MIILGEILIFDDVVLADCSFKYDLSVSGVYIYLFVSE